MEAAEDTFMSSSYWTEGIGPAAALATIEKLEAVEVYGHLRAMGNQVREIYLVAPYWTDSAFSKNTKFT